MTPRGIRNNNPGNLRSVASVRWRGQMGEDDAGFCIFDTAHNGLRANAKQLLAYQDKHGLRTVRGIINRWAPPVENDTEAYVNAVSRALGVGPDEEIDLHRATTLAPLLMAIVQHENGQQPYNATQIAASVADALEAEAPTVPVTPPPVPIVTRPIRPKPLEVKAMPALGLLASILPSVFKLFEPRAEAAIAQAIGGDKVLAGQFLQDFAGKLGAAVGVPVTDDASAIKAVAAASSAPSQTIKELQDQALDYLDRLADVMKKASDLDAVKWTAEVTGKDAAAARAQHERWDMTPYLVIIAGAGTSLCSVALLAAIVYQSVWGQKGIDPVLLGLAGPLLAITYAAWKSIFDYRFDGTKESSDQSKALVAAATKG